MKELGGEEQQNRRSSTTGRCPKPPVNFYTRKDEKVALSRSHWFKDSR